MLINYIKTCLPVDAIAACPVGREGFHVFVAGCYSHEGGKRCGALYTGVSRYTSFGKLVIFLAQRSLLGYGLLDAHIRRNVNNDEAFTVVTIGSDGVLHFFDVELECQSSQYVPAVYGPWNVGKPSSHPNTIGVAMDLVTESNHLYNRNACFCAAFSMSNGTVHYSCNIPGQRPSDDVVNPNDVEMCSFKAHSAETWAVCINPDHPYNLLVTGADDCLMKFWDLRYSTEIPTAVNRFHSMGVTTLTMNAGYVISGSYDGLLRVWDDRHMRSPITTYSTASGDGIWRIRLEQLETNRVEILLAATHGGCEVCHTSADWSKIERDITHTSHQSMAYGIASLSSQDEKTHRETPLYISGSFYDQYIALWH